MTSRQHSSAQAGTRHPRAALSGLVALRSRAIFVRRAVHASRARHRPLSAPRPGFKAAASGLCALACFAAAGGALAAHQDGPGHPRRGGVALLVELDGDADQIEVRWSDLVCALIDRRLQAPATRQFSMEGLSWRKPAGDRTPLALRARLHAARVGAAPTFRIHVVGAGRVRLRVRDGRGALLAEASADGDVVPTADKAPAVAAIALGEPARGTGPVAAASAVELPLAVTRLDALPALPQRRLDRLALGFYYAWYDTPKGPTGKYRHWDPKAPNFSSHDTPVGGFYDSRDPEVIERHMRQARAAGLDGLLVSWWGDGDPDDAHFAALLDAAARHGLRLAPYLEKVPSREGLRAATAALLRRHSNHAAFLRVDGDPALFAYVRLEQELGREGMLTALSGLPAFICATSLDPTLLDGVDALHTYFHAQAYERYIGGSDQVALASRLRGRRVVATVMPAYDDRKVRTPGFALPADGGARWRHDWQVAVGADVVLVTSFNEWHEGSQIEPSQESGETRLQATRTAIDAWRRGP